MQCDLPLLNLPVLVQGCCPTASCCTGPCISPHTLSAPCISTARQHDTHNDDSFGNVATSAGLMLPVRKLVLR